MRTEVRHFHLFCGVGGGARGFNAGQARVGALEAEYRCIGGIDIDPGWIEDFNRLSGSRGTVMDLFTREQYEAFHDRPVPADWREASPQDIKNAAGGERPHIVFLSAPCKGFSGLLSETKSRTRKYQALNECTVRGVHLMLEAWADDPPELVLFENVPRIANRGRPLLDRIEAMLGAYGYATAETTHDCGVLGGLAQRRKRFLLVARHTEKVPPFLYQPPSRPLRAVGDVLSHLPMPGHDSAGPMHRMPRLQWRTWVRLAFVQAGADWRSLNRLAIEDGYLRDYAIIPENRHRGFLGVRDWEQPTGTVTSRSMPTTGAHAVADPRPEGMAEYSQFGVVRWDQVAGTVTGQKAPGQGRISVEDPRPNGVRHNNILRVVGGDQPSAAITAGCGPTGGGISVADPRPSGTTKGFSKYGVASFDGPSRTVIAGSTAGDGAFAVADPRAWKSDRPHYQTGGQYGVVPWDGVAYTVSGHGRHDNGRYNVADPRLPGPTDNLVCRITAEDGTWHRPFSTLELAALQSLLDPDDYMDFQLNGSSDSRWREGIGNAVPSAAAQAIASVMGTTLLLAWSGETFVLNDTPIWVRPTIAALQCGAVSSP